jgi:hypothetical protein
MWEKSCQVKFKSLVNLLQTKNIPFATNNKNEPPEPQKKPMKMHRLTTTVTIAALVISQSIFASGAAAATSWLGVDGASLTTAGNWDNGLPTAANPGTINAGALGIDFDNTITGYVVTQNGGTVTGTAATQRNMFGGSWTINAGSLSVDGIMGLQNGTGVANGNQNFTQTGGIVSTTGQILVGSSNVRTSTFDMSAGTLTTRNMIVNDGSTLNISGGSFTANNTANASGLRIRTGATVNISGGTISMNQEFRSETTINFTGGTTTTTRFNRDAGFGLVMGGTTAGSVTAGTLSGTGTIELNWLSGSLMTFRLTDIADWAETEWTANQMFFNGQSASDLNLNWAQVIDPLVGFNNGGGTYFNWNSTSRTLSLVTIPEPSSTALLALGMVALAGRRHRIRA